MFAKGAIFGHFRSETCAIRYAKWCSDNPVARRLFAPHRYDFLGFRAAVRKVRPDRNGYQNTNPTNANEPIPESHESLR